MAETDLEELTRSVIQLQKNTASRILCALAGPPASGKSTLAEELCNTINRAGNPKLAALLPQDGFHYDDRVLNSMNLLERKGSPDTFDVNGLLALLQRLKKEQEVAAPLFDRELEISRNCAHIIKPENRIIIVEGNYLLLESHPDWQRLKPLFDVTALLEVPLTEIRRRLEQRWQNYGYSVDAARKKIECNDLPNAETVILHSASADFTITQASHQEER